MKGSIQFEQSGRNEVCPEFALLGKINSWRVGYKPIFCSKFFKESMEFIRRLFIVEKFVEINP